MEPKNNRNYCQITILRGCLKFCSTEASRLVGIGQNAVNTQVCTLRLFTISAFGSEP